jgi:hypothetical protein
VEGGDYPAAEHQYEMADGERAKFLFNGQPNATARA